MENWFGKYKQSPQKEGFEDLIGFTYLKKLLKSCIPDSIDDEFNIIKHSYAFLLYGEAGNGKKSLALSFSGELARNDYSFISICGDDLIEDSEKDTCKNIKEFFQNIEDNLVLKNIKNCYIFIDDIFSFTSSQIICRALSKAVQSIINNESINCIVIATVEELAVVPMIIQKVMLPCEVGLPNEQERELCFKVILKEIFDMPYMECEVKYDTMAKMTDGFNYGKIFNVISIITMMLKQTVIEQAKDEGQSVKEYLEFNNIRFTRGDFIEIVENVRKKPASKPVQSVGIQVPYAINAEMMQQAGINSIGNPNTNVQKNDEKTESERPKTFLEKWEALKNSDFNSVI